jgi:hypothetical protein
MQCHADYGFCDCFLQKPEHFGRVSLNRSEQILYDYVLGHKDERQHLQDKVRAIVTRSAGAHLAVALIDAELWRYFEERSAVAPVFVAAARAHGLKRTSMKNLAELLVRLWTEPRPRKPAPVEPSGA